MNCSLVVTSGSTTCQPTATAETVTIEPMIRIQPVIQETASAPIRFDHWYTEPASGYWPASSAKHSATHICPANTTSHDHQTAGPAKPTPKPNS